MSHPLKPDETRGRIALGKPWAAVTVRHECSDPALVVVPSDEDGAAGGICVLKSDVLLADLPDRFSVVGPDGKKLKLSRGRKFMITVESFDPYHLLTEVDA